MSFIDIFTWIVLLIIIMTAVGLFVFLGLWPGKVAHERNHPQADAIQIGSWVTLVLGFVFWPLILIWAYTRPPNVPPTSNAMEETDRLTHKITSLETRIALLEATREGTQ